MTMMEDLLFSVQKNENVEKQMENFEDVSETFDWNQLQKCIYCWNSETICIVGKPKQFQFIEQSAAQTITKKCQQSLSTQYATEKTMKNIFQRKLYIFRNLKKVYQ